MAKPFLKKRSEEPALERKSGVKDAVQIRNSSLPILFCFCDYQPNKPKENPQTFQSWQAKRQLAEFCDKLVLLTRMTIQEAVSQKLVKIYTDGFPVTSKFKIPPELARIKEWAVIKHIGGQVVTVAGFFEANIFHVVFLDEEHHFYPAPKKHT